MVIDIYAMESPRRKKGVRSNSTNTPQKIFTSRDQGNTATGSESQSISPQSSPTLSPRYSSKECGLSRKTSKHIKKCFDCTDDYQKVIGYGLLTAVKENNFLKVVDILYPNVNVGDEDGKTPLIISIQKGEMGILQLLLRQQGIDVNKTDKRGNTPLHHAVLQKNDAIIKLLLDDPRVDSSLKNEDKFFAHQFIDKCSSDNSLALNLQFFMRSRLDCVINEEIRQSQKEGVHEKNDFINQLIVKIKERIEDDFTKQKNSEALPEETQKPIADNVIKKIIMCRLLSKQDNNASRQAEIATNNSQIV